jgi:glycyl-tRNA synthetase beta chain
MYWAGKGGPRFIRPIRWIVALLGDGLFGRAGGVRSGSLTSGHRRLGRRNCRRCADYEQRLRDHYVILSADDRRQDPESSRACASADPALLGC